MTLTAEELAKLQTSSDKLARALGKGKAKRRQDIVLSVVGPDGQGEKVAVPAPAFEIMVRLLAQMAAGNDVEIVASQQMLSTQQAAEVLNVSRPFVVKLLDEGAIPYVRMRSHRRIRAHDLLAYKQKVEAESERALAELTRLSEASGLYDF